MSAYFEPEVEYGAYYSRNYVVHTDRRGAFGIGAYSHGDYRTATVAEVMQAASGVYQNDVG